MRLKGFITTVAALLVLGGCSIEPPLHLRKAAATSVVLQTSVQAQFLWQVDWQAKWDYVWQTSVYGPLGYSEPKGIRMHIYTLDDEMAPKSHNVYNFSGLQGQVDIFVGVHDLLFHNNDSEVLLYRSEGDLKPIHAYTRVISSGLKTSSLVQTAAQKAAATKAEDSEIEENVTFMPDELFVLYDPSHYISDNLDDYEYIDGKYVIRIKGDLMPHTFIYLFQIKLLNNLGRVTGSMGGAALTGVADAVNLQTGVTSETTVSVPTEVYINKAEDPDLMGARLLTFGIPGCDPYDAESVAAAPSGRHYLVLNVTFATGKYKNIRIDVTDQVRALPTGGVIPLEIDVNDFPPEDIDPPIDEGGGGFKPLIGDWNEETGSTTIIN